MASKDLTDFKANKSDKLKFYQKLEEKKNSSLSASAARKPGK